MYELRYLVRNGWDGPEKVLQYRTQFEVTDYSTTTIQGSFTKKREWTDWQDVPTVNETNENIR
jgi:hypothetical protein